MSTTPTPPSLTERVVVLEQQMAQVISTLGTIQQTLTGFEQSMSDALTGLTQRVVALEQGGAAGKTDFSDRTLLCTLAATMDEERRGDVDSSVRRAYAIIQSVDSLLGLTTTGASPGPEPGPTVMPPGMPTPPTPPRPVKFPTRGLPPPPPGSTPTASVAGTAEPSPPRSSPPEPMANRRHHATRGGAHPSEA